MIEVKSALEKIEELLRKLKNINSKAKGRNFKLIKKFKEDFYQELADDFNAPKAFAVLFDFIKKINTILDLPRVKAGKEGISKKEAGEIYKFFEKINNIFGIIDFKKITAKEIIPVKIKKLVKEREKFRKEQNWQKSDELRREMEKQGYSVEDTPSGPIVKEI